MASKPCRLLRRRIAGLILESIALTALPLIVGATVLWGGWPWAVRLGGFPCAMVLLWLTHRHGLRRGLPGMQRACTMGFGLVRSKMKSRSLPATQYQAPLFPRGERADLVVISDLHITVRPDRHSLEQDAFDADAHRFVDALLPRLRPRACLLAGDLTDTGSSQAWRRLEQRFAPWRRQGVELMAVAGNHDVHYRRLEVAAERMGIPGMAGYFKSLVNHPSSAGLCSHPDDRTARRLARLCGQPIQELAPRLHTSESLGADFLLLDSNQRPSHSPASQAIGYVGAVQLERAQALLDARASSRPLYLALHHHLLPPGPAVREQAFLRCLDAPAILAFSERNRVRAVFHGHLHMPYIAQHVYEREGRHELMHVISCGSALYAAEGMFAETVRGASALAVQFEAGRIKKLGFLAAELPVDRRTRPVAEVAARADVESIDHLQHAAH